MSKKKKLCLLSAAMFSIACFGGCESLGRFLEVPGGNMNNWHQMMDQPLANDPVVGKYGRYNSGR